MKKTRYYIYLITNLINNKIYVGKSNNPKSRWSDHKKIGIGGKEKYPNDFFAIHSAIYKYGIDNFNFGIIEDFDTENEAYQYETWWIDFFGANRKKLGYNCNIGGKGGTVPSEESRQRMIVAQNKPELLKNKSILSKNRYLENPNFLSNINKGNQYTKGRQLSNEHKNKLSKCLIGRFISEETKQKMSIAQSGEKHSQSKLTEKDVIELREQFSKLIKNKKQFCEEMGNKYNVNPKTIENIVYRISWKHI